MCRHKKHTSHAAQRQQAAQKCRMQSKQLKCRIQLFQEQSVLFLLQNPAHQALFSTTAPFCDFLFHEVTVFEVIEVLLRH
jgi:hypothetical protein